MPQKDVSSTPLTCIRCPRAKIESCWWTELTEKAAGGVHAGLARVGAETNIFVLVRPRELQSRFGDTPVKFKVVCPKLSPKRDCSPKRANPEPVLYGLCCCGQQNKGTGAVFRAREGL